VAREQSSLSPFGASVPCESLLQLAALLAYLRQYVAAARRRRECATDLQLLFFHILSSKVQQFLKRESSQSSALLAKQKRVSSREWSKCREKTKKYDSNSNLTQNSRNYKHKKICHNAQTILEIVPWYIGQCRRTQIVTTAKLHQTTRQAQDRKRHAHLSDYFSKLSSPLKYATLPTPTMAKKHLQSCHHSRRSQLDR